VQAPTSSPDEDAPSDRMDHGALEARMTERKPVETISAQACRKERHGLEISGKIPRLHSSLKAPQVRASSVP
jgi:hypothetical protein